MAFINAVDSVNPTRIRRRGYRIAAGVTTEVTPRMPASPRSKSTEPTGSFGGSSGQVPRGTASGEAEATRFQAAIFESESQEIGKNFRANLRGIGAIRRALPGRRLCLPKQGVSAGEEKPGKL
jgi:hypothetical protein